MKFQRLVVNGCSYLKNYEKGQGHFELASNLSIPQAISLAEDGSSNSRIFRTTLADSYCDEPTLYVIGLTFIHRFELPINANPDYDGKWVCFNNPLSENDKLFNSVSIDPGFLKKDIVNYFELREKLTMTGKQDILNDLKFRILSMIDSVRSRGHEIVVFNTAEDRIFNMFKNESGPTNIVDNLHWLSNLWQFEQGAPWWPEDEVLGVNLQYRHVAVGQHQYLNQFLYNYINTHLNV
jgi:hypothetical protein